MASNVVNLINEEVHGEDIGTAKEVNRFVGVVLGKMIKDHNKKNNKSGGNKHQQHLCLLEKMRTYHFVVMKMSWYRENCYSARDQFLNDGWHSLVSPAYFHFGLTLMEVIRDEDLC